MTAAHVCLSCLSTREPVRGRCPTCGDSSWRSESVQRNLSDYAKGLDRRTRAAGSLSVVTETDGHYFAVLDSDGSKLMCGFDSAEQAFAWCIHRGHMPVRTDDDVLKILNLMHLSEKKQ